jgi:hypothetical protein
MKIKYWDSKKQEFGWCEVEIETSEIWIDGVLFIEDLEKDAYYLGGKSIFDGQLRKTESGWKYENCREDNGETMPTFEVQKPTETKLGTLSSDEIINN